jgi:hypothetical protein
MTEDWTSETAVKLVSDCVESTLRRFGTANLEAVGIQPEVIGYMQGFVVGRGWESDIMDVLLARLTMRLHLTIPDRFNPVPWRP